MANTIVYPVFLKCCEYSTTDFWKSVLEDLSYGKTPHNVVLKDDVLHCPRKITYKIDEMKDPEKIYNDIVNLFTTAKVVLAADSTKKKIEEFIEANKKQLFESDWSSIRKKSDKDMLLEMFVIDMKIKHKLSFTQARCLLNLIHIALIFKVLTNTDINYSNLRVSSIDGVSFSPGNYTFDKNIYENKKILSEVIEKKYMSSYWTKYVNIFEKKKLT